VRCSTHCPGQGAGIVAVAVLVITAVAVYTAEAAAIADVLEVLLGVTAVACLAGAALVVSVLRRDRGRQWRPAVTAGRRVPAYRVTAARAATAIPARPARAIEPASYVISPLAERVREPARKTGGITS
jgi:hypothetical protein